MTLTKHGDRLLLHERGHVSAGRGRATRPMPSCALRGRSVATALAWDQLGCAAGVADHVDVRSDRRYPQRRALARRVSGASEHVLHPRPRRARRRARCCSCGPRGPAERAPTRSAAGCRCRSATSSSGSTSRAGCVRRRPGPGRRLLGGALGAFPFRDGDRQRGLVVAGRLDRRETSKTDEEPGVVLVLFRSENPDSGGAGALARRQQPRRAAGHRTRRSDRRIGDDCADPARSRWPGSPAACRASAATSSASGSDRVGELLRGGKLPGEPRGRSSARRARCTACARRPSLTRCRPATAWSSSSTAPAATATRCSRGRAGARSTSATARSAATRPPALRHRAAP